MAFLVSFLRHLKSTALVVAGVILLSSCQPPEIPVEPGDNTLCHFEGYDQISVAGYLRIGFNYEGGEVLVTEGGLPLPLRCDVSAERVQGLIAGAPTERDKRTH